MDAKKLKIILNNNEKNKYVYLCLRVNLAAVLGLSTLSHEFAQLFKTFKMLYLVHYRNFNPSKGTVTHAHKQGNVFVNP